MEDRKRNVWRHGWEKEVVDGGYRSRERDEAKIDEKKEKENRSR